MAWTTLPVIALIGLVTVIVPFWLIQPFRPQTTSRLALSYALRRWSPIITLTALISALLLVAWLWRDSRGWVRKGLLVSILLPMLASTWFARQNHFEWMFRPLPNAAYAKTADAGFVADSDMILAVENNGEAVAYPVRVMGYHHLVQDVVGGTPIVATY